MFRCVRGVSPVARNRSPPLTLHDARSGIGGDTRRVRSLGEGAAEIKNARGAVGSERVLLRHHVAVAPLERMASEVVMKIELRIVDVVIGAGSDAAGAEIFHVGVEHGE